MGRGRQSERLKQRKNAAKGSPSKVNKPHQHDKKKQKKGSKNTPLGTQEVIDIQTGGPGTATTQKPRTNKTANDEETPRTNNDMEIEHHDSNDKTSDTNDGADGNETPRFSNEFEHSRRPCPHRVQ